MPLKTFAVIVAGTLLLCASIGGGWAREQADQHPTSQASSKGVDPGVIVIERTLGKGPAETIAVSQGKTIRLVLHAPDGVELHLHGYNLSGAAAKDAPVVMTFRADHAGRFPIEAHGKQDLLGRTDNVLAYLEVRPE